MAQQVQRWIEVTPSQFPHKVEGLNIVRSLLPDNAPFRAWSNLEFRDRARKVARRSTFWSWAGVGSIWWS